MDIALLSVSLNVHSTRRIAEEAEKLGHYVELIDHTKCSVKLGDGRPKIFLGEEDVTNEFDAIIPRIGTKVTRHGAAIVKQFEMNGVFSTARSLSITRARNKVRTLQIMARKGIPIPETLFSINPDNIGEQIRLLGGAPVIIKIQEGTQGMGVILAESKKSAKSIIDTFYKMDTSILLQRFVEEANGEDIRIIVVGNKVVASMKRISEVGEFRSNVHRGGNTEAVEITQREKFIALNATKYLGLGVSGVDLMRSNKGPVLLEVNASPGLKGIEGATGVNVAKHIIQFVERRMLENKDFNIAKGAAIVVPILNIFGFIHFSRDVPDGKDVNRSFPGTKTGSLASRMAYHYTNEILPQIDFGIDLHTGGGQRHNYPQIRYTVDDDISKSLAETFNAPIYFPSRLISGSFRKAAFKIQKPIIVYEAGESMRFDEFAINTAITGIKNVLYGYGMLLKPKTLKKQSTIHLEKTRWVRASRAGMFIPEIANGAAIKKGQVLGVVTDTFAKRSKKILAPLEGFVFCINHQAVVNQGDALFHVGK